MTLEEFNKLPVNEKWSHIRREMDRIQYMEKYQDLRMRFIMNHLEKHRQEELRSMRLAQYQAFTEVKALYSENRDELANTVDMPIYEECKSVLERVFTNEVDEALREIIER